MDTGNKLRLHEGTSFSEREFNLWQVFCLSSTSVLSLSFRNGSV